MSIVSNINKLNTNIINTKTNLKNNLSEKGVTAADSDTLSVMIDKVNDISSGVDWSDTGYDGEPKLIAAEHTEAAKWYSEWNPSNTKLDSTYTNKYSECNIFPNIDTTNVTDMSGAFQNYSSKKYIPLLKMPNVVNMEKMFYNFKTYDKLLQLQYPKVTNMNSAFAYCNLTDSDISAINFPNTSFTAKNLFEGNNLVNIPSMDLTNCTDISYMFKYCKGMKSMGDMKTGNAKYMHGFIYTGEYGKDEPNLERIDSIDLTSYVGGEDNIITGYTDHNKLWLRYVKTIGLGTPRECDNVHLETIPEWGYPDQTNLDSLLSSLVHGIFNRRAAGYPDCNLYIDPEVYKRIEKSSKRYPDAIRSKGYIIHKIHI